VTRDEFQQGSRNWRLELASQRGVRQDGILAEMTWDVGRVDCPFVSGRSSFRCGAHSALPIACGRRHGTGRFLIG